jgi:tripartite-type tricarboxylate transporter receptor subunit TctC
MMHRVAAAVLSLVLLPAVASAQNWPARPITLVVPFAAGGALDLPARGIAAAISPKLGQQVVVENHVGANGNIGAAMVAKAKPDGYTLLFGSPGLLVTNRFMYKNMPFDPDRAFAPVILLGKSPLLIGATLKLPVHNLRELIAYAKSHPGKINVGIPGVGAQAHLTMLLLQRQAGVELTYVPYKGGSGVVSDLIAGQIDLSANFIPALMGAVKAHSLRGLFVTTLERANQLPDVPTVNESGIPGFESVAWYSIVAPAGTPREIIAKVNAAINDYLKSDIGNKQFDTLALQPIGGTPADLKAYIAKEAAKWGPIIKAAGIKM